MDLMLSRLVVSALGISEVNMTDGYCSFEINYSQEKQTGIKAGFYYIGKFDEKKTSARLHIGHQGVRQLIDGIKGSESDSVDHITLCYTKGQHKISQLEPYIGKSGIWAIHKVTFDGLDTEEHLIHVVAAKENDELVILAQELATNFQA